MIFILKERFLKYVKIDTGADANSKKTPSFDGQLDLAKLLVEELKELGLSNINMSEYGYVYALLPSNSEKNIIPIGFIAHMDTACELTGKNVNPQIIKSDGKDIVLNADVIMKVKDFPILKELQGKTLITTDGTTLLGADDKAGIAEIITAMDYLINHPDIIHGDIYIAFTPDEEIGEGTKYFDTNLFKAKYAYTIDGGGLGGLSYENFNAASAKVIINGRSIHPGTAKDKMINSIKIATEFQSNLPNLESPEHTSGYEGFYHLLNINGNVEKTTLEYIIRDFDKVNFEKRKALLLEITNKLNQKYSDAFIELIITDTYFNMLEKIEPVKFVVDNAIKAMENLNIKPVISPIRGGTDGAMLAFKGIATPNIFTGGYNGHGRYEFAVLEEMEKAVEVIIELIKVYANN